MAVDLLIASLGLVILLLAGDSLVKGAVNLSLRLGVPALIVSLTVVAFGTSAPELLISIQAVLEDVPGLALGNVVGSNTANVLLVLGVPALLTGLSTHDCDTRHNYLIMLGATVLFILLATTGQYGVWQGLVLLTGLALMLGLNLRDALAHRRDAKTVAEAAPEDEEELEGADPNLPVWKIALFLVLGLVGLPVGAELLVESSTRIATAMGVSETVIGLTLVAIGTSLPELATTVMAAFRRQADVAIGNVIGSNMFNLLAIIGVASLVGPIPVAQEILRFDIWVMLLASLLLAPFVFKGWHMGRVWGIAFVLLYLLYILTVLLH